MPYQSETSTLVLNRVRVALRGTERRLTVVLDVPRGANLENGSQEDEVMRIWLPRTWGKGLQNPDHGFPGPPGRANPAVAS